MNFCNNLNGKQNYCLNCLNLFNASPNIDATQSDVPMKISDEKILKQSQAEPSHQFKSNSLSQPDDESNVSVSAKNNQLKEANATKSLSNTPKLQSSRDLSLPVSKISNRSFSSNTNTANKSCEKATPLNLSSCRQISDNELLLLKAYLSDAWQQILSQPKERSYDRSVRVIQLLKDRKAQNSIKDLSPSCTRIFLSKGRLYVEIISNSDKNLPILKDKPKAKPISTYKEAVDQKQTEKSPQASQKNHNPKVSDSTDQKPGLSNNLKSRSINLLELEILKSKLSEIWKQVSILPNEKPYNRSVRVTRLLHDHGAAKWIRTLTPNCSRVYQSKGKLFVEVDMDKQILPDPITTIYHHGLLNPPMVGPNFIEAPRSVTKYLYYRFPNFGNSVNIVDLDKRNAYLNGELKSLQIDNQLPSFLMYHEPKFVRCKLHIRESTNENITEFRPISGKELRELYSNSHELKEFMTFNPEASVEKMLQILESLRKAGHIPCDIIHQDGKFGRISSNHFGAETSLNPDFYFNPGAFDIHTISIADIELKKAIQNPIISERIIDIVFHLNTRFLKNEIRYEWINKKEWGQNLIRNASLMIYGEQVLIESGLLDNYHDMAEKLVNLCPEKSWMSNMATDIFKHLSTSCVSEMAKEKFEIGNKSINDVYNSFITNCLSKCVSKKEKLLTMIEMQGDLQSMQLNEGVNIPKIGFTVMEAALRQTVQSIIVNKRKFTIAEHLPLTVNLSTETHLKNIMGLLNCPKKSEQPDQPGQTENPEQNDQSAKSEQPSLNLQTDSAETPSKPQIIEVSDDENKDNNSELSQAQQVNSPYVNKLRKTKLTAKQKALSESH